MSHIFLDHSAVALHIKSKKNSKKNLQKYMNTENYTLSRQGFSV